MSLSSELARLSRAETLTTGRDRRYAAQFFRWRTDDQRFQGKARRWFSRS